MANQSVFNGHVISSLNRICSHRNQNRAHTHDSLPALCLRTKSLFNFYKFEIFEKKSSNEIYILNFLHSFGCKLVTNLKSESSWVEKWKVNNCSLLICCAIGSILGFYEVGKCFCIFCTFFVSLLPCPSMWPKQFW